jgi:hypothetical protein
VEERGRFEPSDDLVNGNAVKDDDGSGGPPVGDERNKRRLVVTDNRAKFAMCKPAQSVDLRILTA